MSDKPEPQLDPQSMQELRKGMGEFNSGRFFECHDTLEDVWQGTRGPARSFFQGLIHAAVGFYHLNNGNRIGGRSQLEKALANLEVYGDRYAGVELAHLRHELALWLEKIKRDEDLRCSVEDLPKLRFG